MFNFNHLTLNTFGETEVYNVNQSSFSSSLYPHHQENGNHVRLSSIVSDIFTTPRYRTRIYYDDVLIFDTGFSTAVDVYGNPLNWPPKATYSNGSTTRLQLDYPSDTANGRTFKIAWKFHDIGVGNQEFSQPRHYLIPDVEYDVIKNGTTFPGSNTTIENTLPAGSHFLMGNFKTTTSYTNTGDYPGEVEREYYFSLIRLNNPPSIYRNSIGTEDGGDNDFNDTIVTVTSGSGFFTGTTIASDAAGIGPSSNQSINVGGSLQNWGNFNTNGFIVNEGGTFNFTIFRYSGVPNKILLYKDSTDYIILSPDTGTLSTTTASGTLTKGRYDVMVRVSDAYSANSHLQVQSIDVNKYPTRSTYV